MIDIRRAVPDDIEGIIAVQDAAGRPAQDLASFVAAITDPDRLVVVALIDGEVGGWGKTHFWAKPSGRAPSGQYLGGLTVAPAHRRRGLGTRLTDARMDWIWQRAPEAWYYTNAQNAASRSLHEQWGFEEVARAAELHGASFDGGVGILYRARRQASDLTLRG